MGWIWRKAYSISGPNLIIASCHLPINASHHAPRMASHSVRSCLALNGKFIFIEHKLGIITERLTERRLRDMKARQFNVVFIKLLLMHGVAALCVARDFDFFYFVQQWPASYCDTKRSCCYPTTGKPAEDFSIHGLWPNYDDGTYPSNCDSDNPFDQSEISDLTERLLKDWPTLACPSGDGSKFWAHEWDKHGTCSENVLNQHSYFQKALDLKSKANLLQALSRSGIRPNGKYYSLDSIKEAIEGALGVSPYVECNVDASGNHQLYQVYLCVDSSATDFIECPVMPHGRRCGSRIEFPSFSDSNSI